VEEHDVDGRVAVQTGPQWSLTAQRVNECRRIGPAFASRGVPHLAQLLIGTGGDAQHLCDVTRTPVYVRHVSSMQPHRLPGVWFRERFLKPGAFRDWNRLVVTGHGQVSSRPQQRSLLPTEANTVGFETPARSASLSTVGATYPSSTNSSRAAETIARCRAISTEQLTAFLAADTAGHRRGVKAPQLTDTRSRPLRR
jgi:hypothetical protein